MCGLVGMIGPGQVNESIYEALTVIQHRGQDAAGIMTCEGTRVHLRKDLGLVRDVFHHRHMAQLLGHYGIGHVRYPTAGSDDRAEAQPFYVNSPFGLALAHNGNLTNADTLRDELFREDLRQLNTGSDSEILLNVLAHELRNTVDSGTLKLRPEDVFAAVRKVFKRCRGAYSVVVLIVGYGLLAFRDPNGIRPLVIGQKRPDSPEASVMLASESVALDVLGYQVIGDVDPGEAVFVDLHGSIHREEIIQMARHAGARRVYFASAAPPVRYPNVYGIDMPAAEELLARERSVEQVAQVIGADRLFYQTLDDLVEAVRFGNPAITRFDTSCFDGTYVTGDITDDYLATVEARRRDDVKQAKESNSLVPQSASLVVLVQGTRSWALRPSRPKRCARPFGSRT